MAEQLLVSVWSLDGCAVVAVAGESDFSVVGRWRDAMAELTAEGGPRRLVVDVSGLRFMGAGGAQALVEAQEAMMARGGSLAVAGAHGVVARMLEITGADQRVPVYGSLRSAVRGRVRRRP